VVRGAADETVKVPQMAESISEGTLKTWQKKVGDAVAADEEVATIETDKACNFTTTTPMTSVFLSPSPADFRIFCLVALIGYRINRTDTIAD
jgi:Biotin-requiring enzyme